MLYTPEQRAELAKERAKRQREYIKSLTPEQKAERKLHAQYRKQDAERNRENRAEFKAHKTVLKKAIAVLTYMKKTDVLFHHHSRTDSMMSTIVSTLDSLKKPERDFIEFTVGTNYRDEKRVKLARHNEYNGYYWNYNSEKSSYMPKAQLGCLWYGPFDTIYDVPLDGSYTFYMYDSGSRGLGTMNCISAKPTEKETVVPYVNPGAIIPITAH